KPAFEKRERELELERTAKRQKLNEPGEQVSNLSFEGNEDKEEKLTEEATPVIDRIINVSAALVNLCPGIVPLD
ncbi:hypothetical protein pdam_00015356, partial [Pocillopora damicornis]